MSKEKRSGLSKSAANPNGKRRVVNGLELAPRSARKNGKKYLKDCNSKDLNKAKIEA